MITTPKNKRRIYGVLGLLAGLLLIIWSYAQVHDRIRVVHLDRIFNPAYGYSVGYRESYFSRDFPSAKAIKEYLTDATILFSQPPNGNQIFYFDHDQGFVSWRSNMTSSGNWKLFPGLQIIELGGRWRVTFVQTYCSLVSDMSPDMQQDNCYDISSIDSILGRGSDSKREYRKGNVFKLSAGKPPPFVLPDSAITIESLTASRNR